ncbi:MMPL family transporter [Skermania sp. ID1734]|uniref:MMPL family transporter n=1 Tax=Skermania sp. ID1734 TaxID=2597516 RepID=UPI00117C5443|nr:MMPL family transporter [Skermania sp. ID1734]TSE00647.1 MMPL family transporter [Skermania sp. ID1734]
MLTKIAHLVVRRPRAIMLAAFIFAVLAAAFGASAPAHLRAGGFIPPDAESTKAGDLLTRDFNGAQPNLILLVSAPNGVDTPAARAVGEHLVDELRKSAGISKVESYWTSSPITAAMLKGKDGKQAAVTAVAAGDDTDAPNLAAAITSNLTGTKDGITVRAGGITVGFHEINQQITHDLMIAEAIAIPITGLLLIWVFGSVIAALLPLVTGIFAIVSTFAILRALTMATDVSIYALNMTTAMGLALAIDYSLFIVSRYREELAAGLDPSRAVVRAVQTAGRTVLFSALTVALSLATLAVFPVYFLKSFAYAGLAVVTAAALASIVILPAALVLLGARVNSLDVRIPLRRWLRRPEPAGPQPLEQTRWYRFTTTIMRRAVPVAIAVTLLLIFVGLPFLHARFGYPDDRVMTEAAPSRQVGDIMRADFTQNLTATVVAVMPGFHVDTPENKAALGTYAAELSRVDNVTGVVSAAGVYANGVLVAPGQPDLGEPAGTTLAVGSEVDPYSPAGTAQVSNLRAVKGPGTALFTGAAALNADALSVLGDRLPVALGLIALASFVILFLFTGSIVLPLKALVLNTLSLTAAFGAMVWIFQEGHLSSVLGFTATGYLIPTMPILMFCVAFGMSMDYEVFLLSRMREEWLASDRTAGANTHAVAVGLARTGRIITAAAALMAVVFFTMTSSKVSFVQLFGLGLTLTVLADATLVRGMLVPALMQLMGRFNWWAPKPLQRLHSRIGLEEVPRSARQAMPETIEPHEQLVGDRTP